MSATQRRDIDTAQLSTLFWINVVGGVLLCLFAVASAPILVAVFGESRLFVITCVLSFVLIGSGMGAQHEAILRRRLDYGYLQAACVGAHAMGLLVGVACAIAGFGYWSLGFISWQGAPCRLPCCGSVHLGVREPTATSRCKEFP